MNNEIQFFGISQKDAFLSMANKIIGIYNGFGFNLPEFNSYRLREHKHSNLIQLLNKVSVIIFDRGDPLSVPVFLKRVATGKIVGLGKPSGDAFSTLEETFLGFGHFRNGGAYTLDANELKALNIYLKNASQDYSTTDFKYKNLVISAKMVKSGVLFPFDKESKTLHNQFYVTVTNVDTNSVSGFDYFDSQMNYTEGKTELSNEDLLNAFDCFVNDGLAAEEDFEDFCSSMGYDSDSRTAERIYKECEKSLNKLKSILDADIYEFANELREAIEN